MDENAGGLRMSREVSRLWLCGANAVICSSRRLAVELALVARNSVESLLGLQVGFLYVAYF